MNNVIIYLVFGLVLLGIKDVQSQNIDEKKNLIGMPFPSMKVKALSGKTVQYPVSLKGKVTLILIAFERNTQEKIDTWMMPFIEKYDKADDVLFYEIPMLKRRWKLMSPVIDRGMRSGIPSERHGNVTTFYGNINKYRKLLNMDDTSDAYVFLLDKNGIIQWHISGSATEERLRLLYEKTESLRKTS
ncbi:hypothetical protein ACFL6G_01815 [candidate division KSB1 bacterium]